jgi:hypothetical protein
MKLISALWIHIWLALSLRHNGDGMPTKLPAAFLLAALYVALNLANKHINGGINLETLLGLSFVAQFYLFGLRTKMIGLFIIISVVINALTLALIALAGVAEEKLFMLTIAEYIMVFAALINIIKSETKAI